MIKLNKDSNSPKMERASAPGIKVKKYNIKGIITIEAALGTSPKAGDGMRRKEVWIF